MVEATEIDLQVSERDRSLPLSTQPVAIDDFCVGDRWSAEDESELAKFIAIIAMGQATQAAHILSSLVPAQPAFTFPELIDEAIVRLSVQEKADTKVPRTGYPRWQRDGFVFEAISWIAARQTHGENAVLLDPHVSSTSQGLDGLMIELAPDGSDILKTTLFEDKCTGNPRDVFTQNVLPSFISRHKNERSAELVAGAATLLKSVGVDEGSAAKIAAAVLDRTRRIYRAAFALTEEHDCIEKRQELFEGYKAIADVDRDQRLGSCFIAPGKLRDWFESLSSLAIEYLIEIRGNDA